MVAAHGRGVLFGSSHRAVVVFFYLGLFPSCYLAFSYSSIICDCPNLFLVLSNSFSWHSGWRCIYLFTIGIVSSKPSRKNYTCFGSLSKPRRRVQYEFGLLCDATEFASSAINTSAATSQGGQKADTILMRSLHYCSLVAAGKNYICFFQDRTFSLRVSMVPGVGSA